MARLNRPCLVWPLVAGALLAGCETLPETGPLADAPDWYNARAAVAAQADYKALPTLPPRPSEIKSDREWSRIADDLRRAFARLARSGGEAASVDAADLRAWVATQTARVTPSAPERATGPDEDPATFARTMRARTVPPPGRGT